MPLEKGYSQVDWLRTTKANSNLNGLQGGPLRRDITVEEVRQHCSKEDAWMVFKDKVLLGRVRRFTHTTHPHTLRNSHTHNTHTHTEHTHTHTHAHTHAHHPSPPHTTAHTHARASAIRLPLLGVIECIHRGSALRVILWSAASRLHPGFCAGQHSHGFLAVDAHGLLGGLIFCGWT